MSDTSSLLPTLVAEAFVDRGDALVAGRIAHLFDETDEWVIAVVALAIRAVREGSSALELAAVAATAAEVERGHEDDVQPRVLTLAERIDVPPTTVLAERAASSAVAAAGVMHVEDALVSLDRHYRDEVLIADLVASRDALATDPAPEAIARADAALDGMPLDATQRRAVESVVSRPLTVLTGGPGMGKTYTLAAVIRAARAAFGDDLRLALAAPTGKAAARMTESLRESGLPAEAAPDAVTLHRLLGFDRSNSQRFRHNRSNPLPHDLVVVDEASMLSLALTARLMEALKPSAHLLLVGDPDQLASVEAGSVLSDLVAGLDEDAIVHLTTHHRLSESRRDLALSFAHADADAQVDGVLDVLTRDGGDVEYVTDPDAGLARLPHVVESAWDLRQAAARGDADAALGVLRRHRLLCAHRTGPYGVARWNRLVEQALIERGADIVPGRMYVGRPLIVTKNDPSLGLFNGDTGVVMDAGGHLVVLMDRGQRVHGEEAIGGETTSEEPVREVAGREEHRVSADRRPSPPAADAVGTRLAKRTEFSPWRLADVETMHAMTVHKAQGSQAEHVTVIVPPVGSRLLTREMLYTALTRASRRLTVVGTDDAIEHAVRTPVRRASGLARRLRVPHAPTTPSVSDGPNSADAQRDADPSADRS